LLWSRGDVVHLRHPGRSWYITYRALALAIPKTNV